MSVLLDILQNMAMGVRPIARFSQRYHSTGLNGNSDMAARVFSEYSRFVDLSGKDILEIGPGQTLEVLERALAAGARSCTAIDVLDYLSPDQARGKRISFVQYEGKGMPLATEAFDLICSYTALEHVRYPGITIHECFRVLRPGGSLVSVIDLGDHTWYGTAESYPDRVFHCLRYPEWLWNLMRWNRSSYVNRLRQSEWMQLLSEAGFIVRAYETTVSESTVQCLSQLRYLQKYQYADAVTSTLTVCVEKPALSGPASNP